jgi:RNA polymerase sigma-70 factor (ECF subfamily)
MDCSEDLIDRNLLAAVAATDRHAFSHLYRRYAARVNGYVRSIVRDPDVADDVVVTTMTAVWQEADSFGTQSRVSTWIFGIARHKAIDAVRARMRVPPTIPVEEADELEEPAASPMESVHAEQLSRLTQRAIALLSAEHQEALRLAFYEDLPYKEISALLNIPANTVKSRVFYAKQVLGRHLMALQSERRLAR